LTGRRFFWFVPFLGFVTTGVNIVSILLGLLAEIVLWNQKIWGAVLVIIIVLIFQPGVIGLMQLFSLLHFGEALLKVFFALAVIVPLLLPAIRNAYVSSDDHDLDLDLDVFRVLNCCLGYNFR